MAKTRGAHSFRPRVRQGPTPPAAGPSPAAADLTTAGSVAIGHSAAAAGTDPRVPTARPTTDAASPAPAAGDVEGSSSVAPAQRRYHTWVRPTPPAPSHPRLAWRASLAKRTQTSGPGESFTSRSRAPPSPPYQGIARAPDLSLGSIIRRPYFPYDPIPGNVSCRDRYFHGEVYYDLSAFTAKPGLRDSMLLIQRYHLEPFMVLRQYYYPRVVIELYHTMTSRQEANPTALHFSIDGRPRILWASDIIVALHLLAVLANAADYRQWPHPPVSSAPPATPLVAPASVPQAQMPSASPQTSGPMPTAWSDIAGSSTSSQLPQYITLSARDFLALMETVRTFSATMASFTTSQVTLAERMTRTEASIAQIQDSIERLESHLGLPTVSPQDPTQASAIPP